MKRISRWLGVAVIAATLYCLTNVTACAADDSLPKYPVKLCSNCGFGSKSNNCVKCGRWVGNTQVYARLCSSCGFGSKKDNCYKCGRWVGNTVIYGKLCSDCGFGQKKCNCAKCGRWAPE
ncbi:MAG: hypothetical protein PHQ75_02595 [Thermoguttaceae bacterium]|nr:hypothetical protein [Thermoguttaceae bacterium]